MYVFLFAFHDHPFHRLQLATVIWSFNVFLSLLPLATSMFPALLLFFLKCYICLQYICLHRMQIYSIFWRSEWACRHTLGRGVDHWCMTFVHACHNFSLKMGGVMKTWQCLATWIYCCTDRCKDGHEGSAIGKYSMIRLNTCMIRLNFLRNTCMIRLNFLHSKEGLKEKVEYKLIFF